MKVVETLNRLVRETQKEGERTQTLPFVCEAAEMRRRRRGSTSTSDPHLRTAFMSRRQKKGRRRQTKAAEHRASTPTPPKMLKLEPPKKTKKKIKGSTLNSKRCLKCRHRDVLEERTRDERRRQQSLVSLQSFDFKEVTGGSLPVSIDLV